jgi:non-specific serine/threonine protein kinase
MVTADAVGLDTFTTFGELLRYLRRRAGLTQRELSIAVGYSEGQISRLEGNQRLPDPATILARFVPALELEKQPQTVARLLELALSAKASPPHNLPLQLTSFIGREREIAEVARLLSEKRLVMLTGPGGCGKTRLALQVAAGLVAEAFDEVWLIELAPLADPALVLPKLAATLGVRDAPDQALLETLAHHLREKGLLLVLDNCEHLVEACAQLAERLLQACPRLRILATSREVLGLPGETVWRVLPLSRPDLQHLPPLDSLTQYEAVRLFVDRAVSALPGFAVTNENASAVALVCHRLDGMPLAIELAAARVMALTVEQIAGRLDQAFRVLTGGSRTALPRHQTLRATLDWGYHLLVDAERMLLRRLSVFAGGWTLEAAESVCAGEGVETLQVLDLSAQLANKSLVAIKRDPGATARYYLLETTRQYAQDKLVESSEGETTRDKHLAYFLQLAEAAEAALHGAEQDAWMMRLGAEHDNFWTALRWAEENQALNAEAGLRLAGAFGSFWGLHGYQRELRDWLERALAQPGPADASRRGGFAKARSKALYAAGQIAQARGDFAAASDFQRQRMALNQELEDQVEFARALREWSMTLHFQGKRVAAHRGFAQAVTILRGQQDPLGLGMSLYSLGVAEDAHGNHAAAQAAFEESLAILAETGSRWTRAFPLASLGRLSMRQGEYVLARARLEEALALRRSSRDKWTIGVNLSFLAEVAWREGDYRRAAALLQEALAMFREIGSQHGIGMCLVGFGGIAAGQGKPARAARLLGAAAGLLESLGAVMALGDPVAYERDLEAIRAQLDQATFSAAWAEGRALTLEQAVAYAWEAVEPQA